MSVAVDLGTSYNIETYDGLKDFLVEHLELDATTEQQLPSLIRLAEYEMDRVLENQEREIRVSRTFAEGDTFKTLGSNARQVRAAWLSDGTELEHVSPNALDAFSSRTGKPQTYSIVDERVYLGPLPTSEETVTFIVSWRLPPLSDARQSNWLLAYHADAYIYSSIIQILAWLENDDRIPQFRFMFEKIMGQINDQGRRYLYPALLKPRVNCVP